jgi:hypothetical protein
MVCHDIGCSRLAGSREACTESVQNFDPRMAAVAFSQGLSFSPRLRTTALGDAHCVPMEAPDRHHGGSAA